ncbi:membrane protein [Salmonella enterica subsp. enterica]|uniref:Membrane protein n=1 Tax=Salmonella enterica I TaxID=59201 RepID=A0A3S4HV49_SALET|nr:membrane protein [Salmonella enterica subsp. enterica]
MAAVQKLLTLIATGLLPVVSLLALLFIVTLPFTGLEAISARVSAAGLLSTLTLMLLLLVAIVNEPQKRVLPYPRVLRGMISASLCVAPIYMLLAGLGVMGTHSAIRFGRRIVCMVR